MKIGLCLAGGGAKGAYQAGVIKALFENGINKFHSISGTSIGAINGYFLFTNNLKELEKMWINMEDYTPNSIKIVDNTVDNSESINILRNLEINRLDMNFYVNYVEIEDSQVKEQIVNLRELTENTVLDTIKYSSLLPFNKLGRLSLKDQFELDLKEGLYNGFKLDGGLIRNTLIDPLVGDNVDKIIVISTRYDYIIPGYILDKYNEEDIILIRPNTKFDGNDTLKFEPDFCRKIYREGYEIGKNIKL